MQPNIPLPAKVVLAFIAVLAMMPASAGQRVDYRGLCDSFECRNKRGELCPSRAALSPRRAAGRCETYDNVFGRITVLRQQGRACRITDTGRTGWTDCNALQYDPGRRLRPQ